MQTNKSFHNCLLLTFRKILLSLLCKSVKETRLMFPVAIPEICIVSGNRCDLLHSSAVKSSETLPVAHLGKKKKTTKKYPQAVR